MTPLAALTAGSAILAAILFSIWTYRRREVHVSGTGFLTGLRALAIGLTALLLVNPRIPGWGDASRATGEWVLLDSSLSMSSDADGDTWARAIDLVPGGGTTVLFGDGARPLVGPIDAVAPEGAASRLVDAVRLAAEGGAPSVRVVSDFRVTDLAQALALVDASGLTAELTPIGSETTNVGVADASLPEFIAADDTASAEVSVFATGMGAGDSIRITVWDEGTPAAATVIPAPGPGALRRVRIRLPRPSGDGGVHRYRIVAEADGDTFAEDDERIAYVRTDRRRGGLVLVSRSPDWEPRFLLPTLADVTGLEPEGFLHISEGRFLEMATGDAAGGRTADSAAVRRRAASAEVLVLHGLSQDDAWDRGLAQSASRLVIIPTTAEGAANVDLTTGRAVSGEWYLDPSIPASPITAGLTGLDPEGLPPVGPVLPIAGTPGWTSAVSAGRSAGGPREAVVAVNAGAGRRRAAVLAGGLWRWAFRGGAELAAYRRLWSAVGGWLIGGQVVVAAADVQPASQVLPRRRPIPWSALGHEGAQLRFEVRSGQDVVQDTMLTVGQTGAARSAPLAPAEYTYSVTDGEGESVGSGRFDVERYVPEMRWPVADPETVVRTAGVAASTRVGGRRLRTSPLPYLLLIAALCAEWYLRRERGLR